MRGRLGLTLLELLITVSVIAILAALAFPNFLEAQTRAKVSASQVNARETIHAISMYRTDSNHYPGAKLKIPEDPFGILAHVQLSVLTTPVAYLTADSLRDPFGNVKTRAGKKTKQGFPIPQIPNSEKSLLYYHYPSFSQLTGNPAVNVEAVGVVSIGPDQLDSFGAFTPFDQTALPPLAKGLEISHPSDTIYDPTNGTLSGGDIGIYTGQLPAGGI